MSTMAESNEEIEGLRRVRSDLVELVGCMVQSNQGKMSDGEAVGIYNSILKDRTYQEMVDLNILFSSWTAKLLEDMAELAGLPVNEVFSLICREQFQGRGE